MPKLQRPEASALQERKTASQRRRPFSYIIFIRYARYAFLYYLNYLLNRLGTVIFQPDIDDCNKSADIERHYICPILLRNSVAFKYRRENVAEHLRIRPVEPQSRCIFHRRSEQASVFAHIAQIRRKIFGRYKLKNLYLNLLTFDEK